MMSAEDRWLYASDRMIACLVRCGWNARHPQSYRLEWSATAQDTTAIAYAYPALPDEAEVVAWEQRGQGIAAALQWAKRGGEIALCPPDRLTEAATAPSICVARNGGVDWARPVALMYAHGYGLYLWADTPWVISLVDAETFRQRAALRAGGRGGATALESDGLWKK